MCGTKIILWTHCKEHLNLYTRVPIWTVVCMLLQSLVQIYLLISASLVEVYQRQQFSKMWESQNIYFHWLTITIYDVKQSNNISDDRVKTVTDNIKKLLSSNPVEGDKILIDQESSFLCQEFQRCFGEVICLHQATIKHNPPITADQTSIFSFEKLRPLLT